MAMRTPLVAAVLLMQLALSSAFYLPGVAPVSYPAKAPINVKVNKLESVRTQLPYDYYSLPFCQPAEGPEEVAENLGEVLSGDIIENSPYEILMVTDESCKLLCEKELDKSGMDAFADKVRDEYRVNMILDNMPAVTKYLMTHEGEGDTFTHYEKGYALGFVGSASIPGTVADEPYINNHLVMTVLYHKPEEEPEAKYRIVGFEVEPYSIRHTKTDGKITTCDPNGAGVALQSLKAEVNTHTVMYWTYDVQWKESPVRWAYRWDPYLQMNDPQIHWFSIINSIMIVLFLTGMIAMIMLRTLHRDLMRYNLPQDEESQQEETGWKLVHGEVFRPPQHGATLSVLLGTGAQLFAMMICTLFFAMLGFLSPANRGGLMSALLLLFVFMGMFAGYVSTQMYRAFKLTEWKKNTFWTAVAFPGFAFAIFFVLNLLLWGQKSSGAVPFFTLVALLVLWFGISVPLVYVGSYMAFSKPAFEPPLRVNNIPRTIPEQQWYMSPHLSVLIGGVLPFGAVFIELFFIMSSIWLNQYYYVFGFLFLVFIILVITCAEISIVMVYFQLCAEDHHWWWRAYFTSGASALYLFLYSFLYFFTKLEIIKLVSGLLFFGYMFLISCAFNILTGTIGFMATFYFVHKIYSAVKID